MSNNNKYSAVIEHEYGVTVYVGSTIPAVMGGVLEYVIDYYEQEIGEKWEGPLDESMIESYFELSTNDVLYITEVSERI